MSFGLTARAKHATSIFKPQAEKTRPKPGRGSVETLRQGRGCRSGFGFLSGLAVGSGPRSGAGSGSAAPAALWAKRRPASGTAGAQLWHGVQLPRARALGWPAWRWAFARRQMRGQRVPLEHHRRAALARRKADHVGTVDHGEAAIHRYIHPEHQIRRLISEVPGARRARRMRATLAIRRQ